MSHKAMTWALAQRTGSPARKAVLMNLADRADEAWSCFPGQRLIAKDTELGERTVRRALDDLETAGLVRRRHHRRKDGSWTSDRYELAGIDSDPDAESLLADSDTSGQSGRRPERPSVTAAADPAATAAGHEPPVTNPHSLPPSEGERAHVDADAHTREGAAEAAEQLPLVDAPAKPAKALRKGQGIPADWALSPAMRAKTAEKFPWMGDAAIDDEAAAFVNWHQGQKSTWTDYDRAWWHWARRFRAPQQRRYGNGRPGPYRNPQNPTGQDTTRAAWESWGHPTEGAT